MSNLPQRVLVMGPPGSGKSTLARRIGARHGLPVFHLDQLFWRPGWIEAPPAEFAADVERIAALPRWVIDGNYTATLACRLRTADTAVFLDAPAPLSLLRILRRMASQYGRVREDAAPGCPERLDLAFLRFAWTWNRQRRARNLAALQAFPGRLFIGRAGDPEIRRL